jgi:low affinity Fe/Cu permease
VGVTLLWACLGPVFRYSDTWQLVINTGTSVATFLVVFLIQNTQNRDAKVMHLKLDELIRAIKPARTELVQMEGLSDDELAALQKEFENWRAQAIEAIATRRHPVPADASTPPSSVSPNIVTSNIVSPGTESRADLTNIPL